MGRSSVVYIVGNSGRGGRMNWAFSENSGIVGNMDWFCEFDCGENMKSMFGRAIVENESFIRFGVIGCGSVFDNGESSWFTVKGRIGEILHIGVCGKISKKSLDGVWIWIDSIVGESLGRIVGDWII